MNSKIDLTGRIMVGLDEVELTERDRQRLENPAVGGVCLFTRNFANSDQLAKLVKDARNCVNKKLVFAADYEGGRVQRFVGLGFPRMRAPSVLGEIYEESREAAINETIDHGIHVARSLQSVGIDFSFAPVLDINYDRNPMIDCRCFSSSPAAVTVLGFAHCQGLAQVGMPSVGKHFPGHGWASADSHLEIPKDARSLKTLKDADLIPYRELIKRNSLDGIMISHVHYTKISAQPATYSKEIINGLLRKDLGFKGLVITDDLVMEGANIGLDMVDRSIEAYKAGCDLLLWLGGEPVLLDEQLKHVPANKNIDTLWLKLLEEKSINRKN